MLGTTDVYAARDMTEFPAKQGGIAAQQADAAASAVAASGTVGIEVELDRFGRVRAPV